MTHDPSNHGTASTEDGALEELLAGCFERPPEEWEDALEEVCDEHPGRADELRLRFDALRKMLRAMDGAGPETPDEPRRLGEFRLLERLGEGGMGVVYRAVQESLGREVALKLIRPDQRWFQTAQARFQREVESTARLRHPGIVPIHAVGEERGTPYYAMELLQGRSLSQALRALRGQDPRRLSGASLAAVVRDPDAEPPEDSETFRGSWVQCCLEIVRQAADALGHAHAHGVLHRDVKPSNLMLTPHGRVVVLDFGLASTADSQRVTRPGTEIGSLAYMSPEQLRGDLDALDARTDVYALAVTLAELITLEHPFLEQDSAQTRQRILEGRPRPLGERRGSIPWDVHTVIQCALDPDPARRYATMADFARDLGHVLALRPIEARRASALHRGRRFVQRHPTASVAVGLGLLLLLAPIVGLFVLSAKNTELQEATRRAKEEAAERQVQLEVADQIARSLQEVFEAGDPWSGNDPDTPASELLRQACEEFLRSDTLVPVARCRVGRELAYACLGMGMIGSAREVIEAVLPEAPSEVLRMEWITLQRDLAGIEMEFGEHDEACARLEEVFPVLEDALREAERRRESAPEGLEDRAREELDNVRVVAGRSYLVAGDAEARRGRLDEADALLDRAQQFAEGQSISPALSTQILLSRSTLMLHRGKAEAVIGLLRPALAGTEQERGGGVLLRARLMQNLADAAFALGDARESTRLLEEAIDAVREEVDEHPVLAELLNNLGGLHGELGEFEQALACYDESLILYRRHLGPGAEDLRSTGLNRADVLSRLGDPVALGQQLQELWSFRGSASWSSVTEALMALLDARRLRMLCRHPEAHEITRRALAFLETVPVAATLAADAHLDLGDPRNGASRAETRRHLRLALEHYRERYGPDHWKSRYCAGLLREEAGPEGGG